MDDLLANFRTISLDALNERASLMRRMDNKYVLSTEALRHFLQAHVNRYDILRIHGVEQFQYQNAYLDSAGFDTFHDHNQGRRRRFKIRFRHYVEAEIIFFEIKLKGFRNQTIKYRLATDATAWQAPQLPENLYGFLNTHLQEHYGYALPYPLQRSLRVDYCRTTLVDRNHAGRITIDSCIHYHAPSGQLALPAPYYVMEVKSPLGRSDADRWLRQQRHRPVQRCSKYCMGINLLVFPERNTIFKPILRRQFGYASALGRPKTHGVFTSLGNF